MVPTRYALFALLLVFALSACTERAVVFGDDGGPDDLGSLPFDTRGRDWVNPSAPNHIFLLSETGWLLRFTPSTKKVTSVGRIACGGLNIHGHSMSVDRYGVAWVNHRPEYLARVNTRTAKCQPTAYKPKVGWDLFGMGFAPPAPGSKQEQLFIANSGISPYAEGYLARLNLNTFKVTQIGAYPKSEASPELTGSSNGHLYGYFPGQQAAFIARLDQKSGKALQTWKLSGLGHDVGAWAFAHWGGKLYQFIASSTGNTRVYRLDPTTGKNTLWVANLGHSIVGAGVSALAPGAGNDRGI